MSRRSPRGGAARSPELFPLDPALQPSVTLNSVSSQEASALENLAQEALNDSGMVEGGNLDHAILGGFSEDGAFFSAAAAEPRFVLDDKERQGEYGFEEEHREGDGHDEGEGHEDHEALDETAHAVAAAHEENGGRRVGRKRRRDETDGVVGPVENGDPIDPVKVKKDSHKEVERRRRENINDGINEIARYVPNCQDPKLGKGMLLKRAAEHIRDITERLQRAEGDGLAEKEKLQEQVQQAKKHLQDERNRCLRYETSWREAEDRAASQQFELDRVTKELEEARRALEAKDR